MHAISRSLDIFQQGLLTCTLGLAANSVLSYLVGHSHGRERRGEGAVLHLASEVGRVVETGHDGACLCVCVCVCKCVRVREKLGQDAEHRHKTSQEDLLVVHGR